ncbi:methyl-accepting chemotaxis protein [Paludibacterium yongneupense]|uniref:methyl-accepting chemotaxis protein n=1 Tax=Paludibacterium yongneupense TaxID=400061 RepID=UPI000407D6DD|nr:methyl-accepting chemotaxis protein [Paludibacterium yongneupense]
MNRFGIRLQLNILVGIAMLGLLIITGHLLFSLYAGVSESYALQPRKVVESATSLVEMYEQKAQRGELAPELARKQAIEALNAIRFEGYGYLFVLDRNLDYLALPAKPQLVGQSIDKAYDAEGHPMKDLILNALASSDAPGVMHYSWKKEGVEGPVGKVGYVARTRGWGWIIGTGVYTDDVAADFRSHALLAVLDGVILLLLLGGSGWYISRGVLARLGGEPVYVATVVGQIAAGKLNTPIDTGLAVPGSLLASVARMQDTLREVVMRVASGGQKIYTMTSELSAHVGKVAGSSTAQSEAAASIAAAIEQLTVSINHVSDNAESARQDSEQAGHLSQQGSRVVQKATDEMENISSAVSDVASTLDALAGELDNITHVVNVIRDVADQTNLLALNAAIEAARAGEQGRGFAVVADEVRKLAERTASATGEIQQTIQQLLGQSASAQNSMQLAVRRVGDGTALARQGREAIVGMEASASEISRTVNDISLALREQSQASSDIAGHVEVIAQRASENASATDFAAASSKQMHELAQSLHEAISHFEV